MAPLARALRSHLATVKASDSLQKTVNSLCSESLTLRATTLASCPPPPLCGSGSRRVCGRTRSNVSCAKGHGQMFLDLQKALPTGTPRSRHSHAQSESAGPKQSRGQAVATLGRLRCQEFFGSERGQLYAVVRGASGAQTEEQNRLGHWSDPTPRTLRGLPAGLVISNNDLIDGVKGTMMEVRARPCPRYSRP